MAAVLASVPGQPSAARRAASAGAAPGDAEEGRCQAESGLRRNAPVQADPRNDDGVRGKHVVSGDRNRRQLLRLLPGRLVCRPLADGSMGFGRKRSRRDLHDPANQSYVQRDLCQGVRSDAGRRDLWIHGRLHNGFRNGRRGGLRDRLLLSAGGDSWPSADLLPVPLLLCRQRLGISRAMAHGYGAAPSTGLTAALPGVEPTTTRIRAPMVPAGRYTARTAAAVASRTTIPRRGATRTAVRPGANGYGSANASYYNPRTGVTGTTNQNANPYSRRGSSTFAGPNQTVNTASGSNARGSAGGFQSSTGAAGAGYSGVNGNRGGAVKTQNGDVYAGHDGNAYQHTSDGWSKWSNGGWQPVNPPSGRPHKPTGHPIPRHRARPRRRAGSKRPRAAEAPREGPAATKPGNARRWTAPRYNQLEQNRQARSFGNQQRFGEGGSSRFGGGGWGGGGGRFRR